MKQQTSPICSQCQSSLIFVSKVTEQLEGARYPQTTTIYRCSNQICQEQIDEEAAKRKQHREEKAQQLQERLAKKAKSFEKK